MNVVENGEYILVYEDNEPLIKILWINEQKIKILTQLHGPQFFYVHPNRGGVLQSTCIQKKCRTILWLFHWNKNDQV